MAFGYGALAVAATLDSPLHFPRRSDGAVRRAAEAGERLLDLDARSFSDLRAVGPGEGVRVASFPFAPDATADLLLERFEVATPDARVLVQTPRGAATLPMPSVTHFRGRLDGDESSRVYLGVQPGFLVAIVKSSAGVVYVGPEGPVDGPVQHVLRPAASPLNDEFVPSDWRCDADDLPQAPIAAVPVGEPSLRTASLAAPLEATALKQATVSIETDQELLAKYSGNVSAMTAYITTLFGAASVIYERDVQVHLNVNLIQAWTTTDPYSSTNTRTQLDEVGDWWHANRPKTSYPRTTVHYMSGKPVSGGIAWLDVLCMGDFSQGGGHWGGAYGVTQVNAAYPSSPWDLLAVSHELGHNFGSPHTHCYNPPIDMCYNAETGCYSGPIVNPGPLGGTIMSYCHLLSGGYGNIDMRFHERCISEQMLPEINSVSCLTDYSGGTTPTASRFYTVAPCRAVDTRGAAGPYGGPALSANTDRTFALGGRCGIPTSAKAVSVNLTVAQPTSAGDLRLYASGSAPPMASAINYLTGAVRANNATAPLGTGGGLTVRCDQSSGSVQAIIDVNGYYQ